MWKICEQVVVGSLFVMRTVKNGTAMRESHLIGFQGRKRAKEILLSVTNDNPRHALVQSNIK
jgi:hypothetical protein